MNKTILLIFALALATHVLSAPQVSVNVALGGDKVADVNFKAGPEDATVGVGSIFAALAPTTPKPLPERVRESVQAAITGAGQAIRAVPATITSALQNFANGVRQALGPRSTTPAPLFSI